MYSYFWIEKIDVHYEIVGMPFSEFRAVANLDKPLPRIRKIKYSGKKPGKEELKEFKEKAREYISYFVLMGE